MHFALAVAHAAHAAPHFAVGIFGLGCCTESMSTRFESAVDSLRFRVWSQMVTRQSQIEKWVNLELLDEAL